MVSSPSGAYIRVEIKMSTVTVTRAAFKGGGGARRDIGPPGGTFAPLDLLEDTLP